MNITSPPFEFNVAHFDGCRRGELCLSEAEVTQLNDWLASAQTTTRWRFYGLPTESAKKAPQPKLPPVRQRRSTESSTSRAESKMAEWARHFHRLVSQLIHQEVARPYVDQLPHKTEHVSSVLRRRSGDGHLTRNSAGAQKQKEILQHIQPYLDASHCSLRNIKTKLENNQYSNQLEAFNEMYEFFLAAYRHYPPASSHWIRVHETAFLFFSLLSSYPLKDDFDGPPSVVVTVEPEMKTSAPRPPKPKKPKKERSERSRRKAPEGGELPVRNRERRLFQRLLVSLPMELHRELYAEFQDTAVWTQPTEGQVELDEARTSATVFRQMLDWCAARTSRKRTATAKADSEQDLKKRRASMEPPEPVAATPSVGQVVDTTGWAESSEERSSSDSSSTESSSNEND